LPQTRSRWSWLVCDADLRLLANTERLRQHWATHAAALGLTAAQVKVLLDLTPREATPMCKLARQFDYDASNLTTHVDCLARRRALEHRAETTDRGVKAPMLTPAGRLGCRATVQARTISAASTVQ
jgi:DNA-binding MarR family transcriptional regulator